MLTVPTTEGLSPLPRGSGSFLRVATAANRPNMAAKGQSGDVLDTTVAFLAKRDGIDKVWSQEVVARA